MDRSVQLDCISRFLAKLGFSVQRRCLTSRPTFIPGIYVEGMTLLVDTDMLLSPGDILHDAGHVAITPSIFRPHMIGGDFSAALTPHASRYCDTHPFIDDNGTEDPIYRALLQVGEHEAQAWSYAAVVASGIPPESVFHADGYEGRSEEIMLRMSIRRHFGINGLQAAKMTTVATFPAMIRWLQI